MKDALATPGNPYPPPQEDMGSSDVWVSTAQKLLSHKLLELMPVDGADQLRDPDVIETVMDQLRSFVPLKVQMESTYPQSDDLAAVHNNLVDYGRRVLLAANQAIHNNISAMNEERKVRGQSLARLRSQTEPHRRMLLEWQLRRIEDARQQFLQSAAAVDGPAREIVEQITSPV